ncbi:uncharacterized protein LOC130542528 [Ursus arctos]|uniref:uncharacterized protein LOC130542528 n=1 Tax=Ursus arctos TaxID=9644 RepID=UPI00254763D8|nr:uncharacterized protein LOC130542528 [Ursus arctos]
MLVQVEQREGTLFTCSKDVAKMIMNLADYHHQLRAQSSEEVPAQDASTQRSPEAAREAATTAQGGHWELPPTPCLPGSYRELHPPTLHCPPGGYLELPRPGAAPEPATQSSPGAALEAPQTPSAPPPPRCQRGCDPELAPGASREAATRSSPQRSQAPDAATQSSPGAAYEAPLSAAPEAATRSSPDAAREVAIRGYPPPTRAAREAATRGYPPPPRAAHQEANPELPPPTPCCPPGGHLELPPPTPCCPPGGYPKLTAGAAHEAATRSSPPSPRAAFQEATRSSPPPRRCPRGGDRKLPPAKPAKRRPGVPPGAAYEAPLSAAREAATQSSPPPPGAAREAATRGYPPPPALPTRSLPGGYPELPLPRRCPQVGDPKLPPAKPARWRPGVPPGAACEAPFSAAREAATRSYPPPTRAAREAASRSYPLPPRAAGYPELTAARQEATPSSPLHSPGGGYPELPPVQPARRLPLAPPLRSPPGGYTELPRGTARKAATWSYPAAAQEAVTQRSTNATQDPVTRS